MVRHDDLFHHSTPDEEWIPIVGRRGWALLTKDERLRRNSVQRALLLGSGVRAFVFSEAQVTGAVIAAAYVRALPRMWRIARSHRAGFIAVVNRLGGVRVVAGG